MTIYNRTPKRGDYMTLNDLIEFVAEMSAEGVPADAEVRCTGAVEINLQYGPRITKLTVADQPLGDGMNREQRRQMKKQFGFDA